MNNMDTQAVITHTESWDEFFLTEALNYSRRSKDPSTKVGACIVRPDKTVVSMGFNGFPRGMADFVSRYENREDKYNRVIHAEMNAILFARERLDFCTLYVTPLMCCHRCAPHIIQAGIKRVVFSCREDNRAGAWSDSTKLAMEMFNECGVRVSFV